MPEDPGEEKLNFGRVRDRAFNFINFFIKT